MKTKKELKAAAKQIKAVAGVFQIENSKNNMILLEAAPNVQSKWNRHRTELRFGSHRNAQLQKDWKEMGEENFNYSVVSELEIKDDASFDLKGELALLLDMVAEDMNIQADLKY